MESLVRNGAVGRRRRRFALPVAAVVGAWVVTPTARAATASGVDKPRAYTWGVSGPAFLTLYCVLIAAVAIVVFVARRRLRDRTHGALVAGFVRDPCDLAMLNGGDTLAVATAVAQLRSIGALEESLEDASRVNVVGDAPPNLDQLERSIFEHLRANPSATAAQIAAAESPAAALDSLHARLVDEGLLLSEDQRARIRRHAAWVVPLLGLGVARIMAGAANHRPVAFLVILVVVAGSLMLRWSLRAPRATALGVRRMREANDAADLAEDLSPADDRLGLFVALLGPVSMWNTEPWLAAALDLPKKHTRSWSPGGCGGGGCGGGGCGGGCGG